MGSATFNYTGGWQHFSVPTDVTSIVVTLNGAGTSGGHRGGRVVGRLSVKDTDTLYMIVGGVGKAHSGGNGGAGGFGAGGDGGDGYNANGGGGGGGYTAIRLNSTAGSVKCVAGGAGGDSGDAGDGGNGGGTTGQGGSRGNAGSGATGQASGGTQTQGGNGGTSSSGSQFAGHGASDSVLGTGGNGGSTGGYDGPGGGGGGGGYHSGGGGQGGSDGWAPGGGGAGGASYTAGLTSVSATQGGGATGNGSITLSWSDPAPANSRPNNPSSVTPAPETRLKSQQLTLKATVSDTNGNNVRLRVQFSHESSFAHVSDTLYSPYVATGKVATLSVTLASTNTHYYVRVYAQDVHGALSLGYTSTNFYSNYSPDAPTLLHPSNGAQDTGLGSIVFTWSRNDPDGEASYASQLRYYRDQDGSYINTRTINGPTQTYTEDPLTFKSNQFYLWQVRTQDPQGLWSPWADPFRFFISGTSTPPRPTSPVKGEALDVGEDNTFKWRFIDPDQGDTQNHADWRYKQIDQPDSSFITILGASTGLSSLVVPAGTFAEGFEYVWQVRTYDTLSGGITPSDWSDSASFRTVATPGASAGEVLPTSEAFLGTLGCGVNKAYLAVKGGKILLGELGPTTSITWGRSRDDMSTALVVIPVTGNTICQLASVVRCWQHEVIVYRESNGFKSRVWEGPVTRVAYHQDRVEIEARDVMAWPYRRIMKQGYNDAYPNTRSVVDRAARIIINALARDDPGILTYLTQIRFPDDAKQSRVRADWQSSAFDEVDDLAANAGLDYTVVGRRIILWDTHRSIGRLPVMRSKDFSDPPVVTEYGMNLATEYGITNNAGVFASATRDNTPYGPVELLSSAYGEQAAAADATLTSAAKQKLIETFGEQAERSIGARYPSPLVVRVPDNSTLKPEVPVSIDHLVPGVWIPLQAEHVCRTFSQWQKLDSVTVTQTSDGEQVQVVMSPAPNAGLDPDADAAAEAASGD